MKYHLPLDPAERVAVWCESLKRIGSAEIDVALEGAQIDIDVAKIEMRQAAGEPLLEERNSLKKRELENRMMVLCLAYQKDKLEGAINDVRFGFST